MRMIYENYRGFQIYQLDNSYNAVTPNLVFRHSQLSQLLNKIDLYLDSQVLHIAT